MLVPWYLMAAYAYYHLDQSLMSDAEFDEMAIVMLENYESIEHRHKHLITKEELEAGTLLLSLERYPTITKDTAVYLLTLKQEHRPKRRLARKNK
jgi:hypothetical protein